MRYEFKIQDIFSPFIFTVNGHFVTCPVYAVGGVA